MGPDPVADLIPMRIDALINCSASPFGRRKAGLRRQLAARAAQRLQCPVVYVNQVGGNDELVFDGASFVMGETSDTPLLQLPDCREATLIWDASDRRPSAQQESARTQQIGCEREDMEALATAVERHRGELKAILFTHSHGDHLADMSLLREAFDVPVWGSDYTAKSVPCQRVLTDGETLTLGRQNWTVLITPGHHPGHVCLFSEAGLVAGDMLAGIGTILIPPHTGDMNEYLLQLERLKALKPHLVFPSHGPVVAIPDRLIDHYLSHRRTRHARVLEAVRNGASQLVKIAEEAYADTPDAHPGLALDQTLSHLLALEASGKVKHHQSAWHMEG